MTEQRENGGNWGQKGLDFKLNWDGGRKCRIPIATRGQRHHIVCGGQGGSSTIPCSYRVQPNWLQKMGAGNCARSFLPRHPNKRKQSRTPCRLSLGTLAWTSPHQTTTTLCAALHGTKEETIQVTIAGQISCRTAKYHSSQSKSVSSGLVVHTGQQSSPVSSTSQPLALVNPDSSQHRHSAIFPSTMVSVWPGSSWA